MYRDSLKPMHLDALRIGRLPFYDDSLDPGNPTLRWVLCARTVPGSLYQDAESGEFLLRRIDIGRLSPAFPVTPPYVGVRIRRFRDLSPVRAGGSRPQFAMGGFAASRAVGLHPIFSWQAPPRRIGGRMAIQENRVLRFALTVGAFPLRVGTMADLPR